MINGVGHRFRRGAYLLPSAFTIGNMLLGFYAIVRAYRGDFKEAAVMVMIAGVLDGLDGRIARLTGTDSEFGKEYDSLADVFTFGVAPALLSYFWGLDEHGRLGWLIPLFFLVCTATRLARFNVQTKVVDSRYFVGLPSPAAAGGIVSALFFAPSDDWKPWAAAGLAGTLVILGSLMVSTFRYRSFKKINLRQRWSYRIMLPVAAVLLVAAYHPPAFFLAVAAAYTISGPAGWLMGRLSRKPAAAG
jgi:CDP-diacylglycerol--serine O-phosphatidyltransferase